MVEQFIRHCVIFAAFLLVLWQGSAYALTPEVRGSQVRDFHRLTFEWPRPTYLTADIDNKKLTIHFERQISPNMSQALKKLKGVVRSHRLSKDGRTLTIQLNKPYQVRSFVSGNISGVDIIPSRRVPMATKVIDRKTKAKRSTKSEKQSAAQLAQAAPAAGETEPEAIKQKEEKKPVATTPASEQTPTLPSEPKVEKQAIKTEETPANNDKVDVSSEKKQADIAATPSSPVNRQEKAADAKEENTTPTQAVATEPAEKPAVDIAETTTKPENTPPEVSENKPSKVLRVRAKLENEMLTLQFPWQKRTAAAAYIRNNIAWVVFDRFVTLELKQVNMLLRAGATIKQLPINEATVFYMPVSPGAGIEMKTVEGTFRWQLNVLPGQHTPDDAVKTVLHTEPPLKPHVFLPLLDVGKLIHINDPVIGDDLDILPVYSTSKGLTQPRFFAEFTLLNSAQGLVVLRRSDDTTVELVRNGVRVSTRRGATITPNLPLPEDVKTAGAEDKTDVLFPYEAWKAKEDGDYTDEINFMRMKLARSLVSSETGDFLRLAQLHLAYGEAVEALGYLNNIKRIDRELFIEKRLSAMQGAANFLLHRYQDAARNFNVPELKNIEEVEFWRVMLSELLGKPTRLFDYEKHYEPYISHYPPIFKQRIGIFAADRAIAAKEYNAAIKIFDQLNEHELINEVADYINYLMGKIALDTQQPSDGYELWEKLTNGPATEFVKVRAEFSLIVEQLRRKQITHDDALNRLERLAIRWRGDNLELAVLSALSELYERKKNWPNAIRIWRAMNEAFPNTVEAVEASRKMDDGFISVFDKGETAGLSDLELIFLYNQHRELIPEDEVGDRIVENLADLMVELDMLGPAAEMLEQRMRYRFEHVDRSKVGAKLAEVYLLDQKPKKALQALQLSVFGMLPEPLLRRRTYLNAEALLALKRFSDLFVLLEGDKSSQADFYRLQAHWIAKDWEALAENGEHLLKNRKNPTAPLSDIERETLVKLALAYVALEETEQLAYLRDYFTPLMQGKPKSEIFTYLTQPYLSLTPDNFDEVVALLDNTQTFLATDYGTKPQPKENQDG